MGHVDKEWEQRRGKEAKNKNLIMKGRLEEDAYQFNQRRQNCYPYSTAAATYSSRMSAHVSCGPFTDTHLKHCMEHS
jgi:hypothetical protein